MCEIFDKLDQAIKKPSIEVTELQDRFSYRYDQHKRIVWIFIWTTRMNELKLVIRVKAGVLDLEHSGLANKLGVEEAHLEIKKNSPDGLHSVEVVGIKQGFDPDLATFGKFLDEAYNSFVSFWS